jgi:phosphatidylglycerol:prolipoprotein diacylglycerol transferase
VFAVWQGGMSFHGGMLGVVAASALFARRRGLPLLEVGDTLACATPIGLFLGRLANFVNGELWGRTTDVAWGMVFPSGGPLPRHPSQLYEAFLEGIVLFFLLMVYRRRTGALDRPGELAGLFCIGYGTARFVVEFFRQPDAHLGYLWDFITMGQILSLPLIAFGAFLMWLARRRARKAAGAAEA